MKAMILAAGLGTRLRPLTEKTPKALIPVGGRPLIHYSLLLLKKYGFRDVLINLHYLGDQIEKALGDGRAWGLDIRYSWEPELLGTGGGIKKAESFFRGESLLVLNSDILIDVDLNQVMDFHEKRQAAATMVLRPLEAASRDTPLFVGADERIVSIQQTPATFAKKRGYTGVQILTPRLTDYLPAHQESCIIQQAYRPALADGLPIFGFEYTGYWNDLGTLVSLQQAELDLNRTQLTFMN